MGLDLSFPNVLIRSLQLIWIKSYDQKGVFHIFGDLDLDLGPIWTKNNSGLKITFANIMSKFEIDQNKTVSGRERTDKQTHKRTNGTDQHTWRKIFFAK